MKEHPLQIDEDVKRWIHIICVVCAIALTKLTDLWFGDFLKQLPVWLGDIFPATPFAIFGLVLLLFNKIIWRHIPRNIGFLYTPDMSGKWNGSLKSSHDGFKLERSIEIFISQSGSQILIKVTTDKSCSHSTHAIITKCDGEFPYRLIYHYQNEPKASAENTMHIHTGVVWLDISSDLIEMKGEYFTGRSRHTHGEITLRRQPLHL